tara:strand:+ start:296 stop:1294 length:999 start_codon:yes stop_codon:yes gene_type:complete
VKIILFIISLFISTSLFAEPNVLKCKKNCGTTDTKGEFTFQARLSMGSEKWGGNISFIEDDIAISQAHVIGLNPEKKICCTPKEIKKAAEDWKQFKNEMYVVEGNSYQGKQKIIGKVLDIAGRANGFPPGYDLLLLHVDRDCNQCQKNKNIKIKPIPLANNIPEIGTTALHICIPEKKKYGKGIISIPHTLNGMVFGAKTTQCTRQIIKHDGVDNPPMLFAGCSGSPVIYKECGKNVVHGLHGNGIDEDKIMYEILQLVQTQKEWVQSQIYEWTGRTDILDACDPSGRRSFMPDKNFDINQNGCQKKRINDEEFIPCDVIDLKNAINFPWMD